jgi:DNA-binding CsgD family transcriptional regulator
LSYFGSVPYLSGSDYRGVLGLLWRAGEDEAEGPLAPQVLAEFRRLVQCDVVSYGEFDASARTWRTGIRMAGEPRGPFTEGMKEAQIRLHDQIPFRPWAPRARAPFRQSDVISRRELRRQEIYWEIGHPAGLEHQLWLWLHDRERVLGGLAFDRHSRDFTERDVRVLETLQPHLARLVRTTCGPPAQLLGLTRRETEILRLVACGAQNRAIAASLFISPGTVRKHLSNVYEKLGVPNRTTAARRLLDHLET